MGAPLRVLIVEDSEDDAALLLRELQRGGYDPAHQRVETSEAMSAALDRQDWDIVFGDYTMPRFRGTEALALLRGKGLDTPFIFVSGTIGEDMAVVAMKAGANDYITKGNLKRLIPAVDRELREAEVRRERKRAEEALRESNQTLQAVVQSSPLAIIIIDLSGKVLMWNPAAEQIFGWSEQEVLGEPLPIVPQDKIGEFHANIHAVQQGKGFINVELRRQRKDGVLIDISVSTALLRNNKEEAAGIMGIIADITERKKAEAVINHMAYYDTLTDLPNRTLLRDRLQKAILTASYQNKAVALLLIDLDRFREINDTLGHHRGDVLLQQIGPRLSAALRDSDSIARLGGDEFAVILPLAEAGHAELVARKILEALEKPFVIEGVPVAIEGSIGIAVAPEHGGNPDSLIQRADIAMYIAKENRTGYTLYSSEIDQHSPRRLALLGELRGAIDNDQLFLHYQPKVCLQTGRITGVEALVRWQHPQYGVVPPDQFIMVAERSGLIKPLTRWVLDAALRQCQTWHQEGTTISMAVNLSARNLQDPELPEQIANLLQECRLAPSFLELEITESALMIDPLHAIETMTRLSSMGIQFSIDDFGTGYSSLGYLKKLPVHQIKIDRSFTKEMALNPDDAAIVRSTIELGHNLGLKVVAEGVENQETWGRLESLNCDAAQGYHISHPLPPFELNRWLSETAPQRGWTV